MTQQPTEKQVHDAYALARERYAAWVWIPRRR